MHREKNEYIMDSTIMTYTFPSLMPFLCCSSFCWQLVGGKSSQNNRTNDQHKERTLSRLVEKKKTTKTAQSLESCPQNGNRSWRVNNLVHLEKEIFTIKHDRYTTLGETTLWAAGNRGSLLRGWSHCSALKSFLPSVVFGRRWYSLAGEFVVLLFPCP